MAEALSSYVGPALKRIRLQSDLSQRKLSSKSGIPTERVSRYENGHVHPTIDVLERFAKAFGTTVSDIIATAEDERGE